MREFTLDDINPIEAVMQRVWDIFNVLRNEAVRPEDYHIVLLLLSYYREGILSDQLIYETRDRIEFERLVYEKLHRKNARHDLIEIHNEISPILRHIKDDGLHRILGVIGSINKKVLDDHFPGIFDSVLHKIIESQGVRGVEHLQPLELSRFISGLTKERHSDEVFNPFAGLASYGVSFENGSTYYGQELNRRTWAIGALRIIASRRPGTSRFSCDNSISNWPDRKFDLIVSTPPFRARISHNDFDVPPFVKTAEQFLLYKGLSSLTRSGRMIVVLPLGFLSNASGDKKIREMLVESGNLETVISLPSGIFQGTGIKTCILIINKQKETRGMIRFINADSLYNPSTKKKTLDDYKLGGIYADTSENNYSWFVDIGRIREDDYSLVGDRYRFKNIDGVQLNDIIKPFRGFRAEVNELGPIVRIRDLSNDPLNSSLDLSKIDVGHITRPGFKRIDSSCLLLATRWKSLKPTYFKYVGIPIYISNDIEAFFIDSSKVNSTYLINELDADYVKEQLEGYSTTGSIPSIRKADILKIVVKLPSIQEQEGKVQGLFELSDKIKSLEAERNALAHGQTLKKFDEFASLKHSLGRPRQNILDWADNILDFLTKNEKSIESINNEFKKFYGLDVIEALKEIKKDVGHMTEILEKGENGLILDDYPLSLISLKQLNNFVSSLNNNGFKFELKKFLLKGQELGTRGIKTNVTLLQVLLDNVLTNANKYAFPEKNVTNEVVIELVDQDDYLFVRIRNNGNPFPKNFTQEKFTTKYTTAHPVKGTGLGGYDINRIATYFGNPNWELHLDDKDVYPVEFEFKFKIKLIG